MSGERLHRHANPRTAPSVVRAANELYCSICNSEPCFLLSTAALAVLQEQLNCDRNLVGAVRYVQSLDRLKSCLERHISITRDEYALDEHFRVSDEVLEFLKEQQVDVDHLKTNLIKEEKRDITENM